MWRFERSFPYIEGLGGGGACTFRRAWLYPGSPFLLLWRVVLVVADTIEGMVEVLLLGPRDPGMRLLHHILCKRYDPLKALTKTVRNIAF